jgi:hypothetical protein
LLIAVHAALYFTAVLWVLSPLKALAFIAVQQALFSLHLGCSSAPNHNGMPIIQSDAEMSFARRQVITARNITGGRLTTLILGGLNYQIEHHLFPTMPRPNLARAQSIIRAFCVGGDLGYCEDSLVAPHLSRLRLDPLLEAQGGILMSDPVSEGEISGPPAHLAVHAVERTGVRPAGLRLAGLLTLLLGAWAGIVPFVGPSFGYSADGAGSWHWSLSHALLWLAPGAASCLTGLVMMGIIPLAMGSRGRVGSGFAGLLTIASGAWLVVGALAWPILESPRTVFALASPFREFTYQIGYSLGPGVILSILGAFALGWAMRGQIHAS